MVGKFKLSSKNDGFTTILYGKDADLISDDDIKFAHKRYKEIDAEIERNRKKFPNYYSRRF